MQDKFKIGPYKKELVTKDELLEAAHDYMQMISIELAEERTELKDLCKLANIWRNRYEDYLKDKKQTNYT